MKNWIVICLLVAACVVIYFKETGKTENPMNITRIDDIIEIQGKSLKALSGTPISKLRLFVFKNGNFLRAPYQVDERDPKGEWVFTIGEEKSEDVDKGMLDDNDELAFMAKDLGGEAPTEQKPKGANSCYKITVSDPVDHSKGFAYLCAFDTPPPPSTADYVSYKVEGDWMWMIGETYKIGTGVEESYFDKVHLRTGPTAPWGTDIMDRYKTRGVGIPIPGKEVLPESNAKAKAVAWIDGPVRVIRKSKGWLKVAWKIKIHGEGSSQNIYYPTWFVVPLRLGVPQVPKPLLKNFKLLITLDFNHNFYGTKYYDEVNPQGVLVDGQMSDAERKLECGKHHEWYAVTGTKGTVMARYVLPPDMKKWVKALTYYMDDKNLPDPPEEEVGQSNFGFMMENFADLPAGEYRYSAYFYFPRQFKWGEQARILNILDKPLQVNLTSY